MNARIFVSYSRKDQVFATRLADALTKLGADVWIDLEDIPAGTRWSKAIQNGLDTSDLMVVLISPSSSVSPDVEDEWNYFIDQSKPIVPLLVEPARVHYQLSRIQYINFYKLNFDEAMRQLHAELLRRGMGLRHDTEELRAVKVAVDGPLPVRPETLAPHYGENRRDGASPFAADVTRPTIATPTIKRQGLVITPPKPRRRRMLPMVLLLTLMVAAGAGAVTLPHLVSGASVLPPTATNTVEAVTEVAMVVTDVPTRVPTEASTLTPEMVWDGPTVTIFNTPAVNLRRGPSAAYSQADTALSGEVLPVLGQDSSQTWYLVALADNEPLWVSAYFAELEPANARPPIVNPRRKLVLNETTQIREEPGGNEESVGTADASAVAYMLREQTVSVENAPPERWQEVIIQNGLRGWILSSDAVAVSTPRPGSGD